MFHFNFPHRRLLFLGPQSHQNYNIIPHSNLQIMCFYRDKTVNYLHIKDEKINQTINISSVRPLLAIICNRFLVFVNNFYLSLIDTEYFVIFFEGRFPGVSTWRRTLQEKPEWTLPWVWMQWVHFYRNFNVCISYTRYWMVYSHFIKSCPRNLMLGPIIFNAKLVYRLNNKSWS